MPKLMLNDNGNAVVKDGKVQMLGDDGKEFPFDAEGAHVSIARLRVEAQDRRQTLRETKEHLEKFKDIEDPEKAVQALQTVSTMGNDHKTSIENLKTEMNSSWSGKVDEKDKTIADLQGQIYKHRVGDKFHSSAVAQTLIYPPEDSAVLFGSNFEISEDGQMVGKLNNNIIYSREKPGEPAGFDESLQVMIDARPNKESILKGTGMQGSGTPPGPGQNLDNSGQQSSQENISEGLKARGWT